MTRIELLHQEGMLRIAAFENVQINVWTDAPDVVQMRAFVRTAAAFCASRGKATALLNAVIRGTPRFSEGVRDEVGKAMRLRGVFKLGAAHLVTVSGLGGSATRAFLSTAVLLSRPKTPTRVFSDDRSACTWVAEQASKGRGWNVIDLQQAYKEATSGA